MVPGYDSTRDVLSRLGCSDSPVRMWINGWWCLFGLLVAGFAWGYFRAFAHGVPFSFAGFTALLLVVFGLGAGPCAGLFPMDMPGTPPTLTGSLHQWLSGCGFIALFFIPALGLGVFRSGQAPAMLWMSAAAQTGGIMCAILIGISERPNASGILAWAGLWQRAFLANYYVYLIAVALPMLRFGVRG